MHPATKEKRIGVGEKLLHSRRLEQIFFFSFFLGVGESVCVCGGAFHAPVVPWYVYTHTLIQS